MLIIVAGILIGLSAYSLYSTVLSWRAVRGGRVHIDTIRDLTGLVDREEINRRFGAPDAQLSYEVTPNRIKRARTTFAFLLSSEVINGFIIAALGLALYEGSTPLGWSILAAAAFYIISGYILAAWLIAAHIEQLEEEI